MKKIALISTFCDTEEKQNILKENIIKIKSLGIDVMAISPIEIPYDITKLCDFFFYTKENPLLGWPERAHTQWYRMPISENRITEIHRAFYDYGWAALYQTKKLSQLALTFDYDIFYHLIYDLEIDDIIKSELKSNEVNWQEWDAFVDVAEISSIYHKSYFLKNLDGDPIKGNCLMKT
jgi:hypothetical protein